MCCQIKAAVADLLHKLKFIIKSKCFLIINFHCGVVINNNLRKILNTENWQQVHLIKSMKEY